MTMRMGHLLSVCVLLGGATVAGAAEIEGEYLEARTCNVYTGPCFANGEIGLAGKEAVMAWKVEKGGWDGVDLAGCGVAVVLSSETTLGDDEVFARRPGKIESVILVDDEATKEQKAALVAFVKETAKEYTRHVRRVASVPVKLENDHVTSRGVFTAGDVAKIETRELRKGDCVCSNEIVFYQPLIEVENAHPAYSLDLTFQGQGLDKSWKAGGERGAFLATFRR
jgi:hypothetical protein